MSSVQSPVFAQSPELSSLKPWIYRHPVAAYFGLAYLLTWSFQLPMVLGQDGLGILPFHVPLPIYVILFLLSSFVGPTGAAVYVTSVLEGKQGVRTFFRRYIQWRFGMRWYLFAFFAFPAVSLLSAGIVLGAETTAQALAENWHAFFTTYLPALLIFPALITWGEEPGWRGFALTRMQEKHTPLVSSLVVGLMHGLWHLPVFLIVVGPPALGPFDPVRLAINTFGIMMITVIWTWAFNHTRESILMAVLLHASTNATAMFMNALLPGFSTQEGYVTMVICLVLAVVILIATKGRLGYDRLDQEQTR
jgi:uncharacterized protein